MMLGLGAWFLSLSIPLEATGTATAEPQQGPRRGLTGVAPMDVRVGRIQHLI
jgi:hypothetical protein